MPLTNATLATLPLGYLSGEDLMGFCPAQLLIQRNLVLPGQPLDGCVLAYAEIESSLMNRYNVAPELLRLPPLQGVGTAAVGGGAVSAITISFAGGQYASAPAVTITGGGGTGAAATATVVNGILTAINVTNGGTGFTSAPVITLTGGLAPDPRAKLLVKITSIISVRNVVGAAQNISPQLEELFKWADKTLLAIRNAQMNLPLSYPAAITGTAPDGRPTQYWPGDGAELIDSSFNWLG